MAADAPFSITLRNAVTFVVLLFAFGQSELELYFTIFKIKRQGNKCITFTLFQTVQTRQLSFMKKQLSRSERIHIKNVALFIGRDMHLIDIKLSIFKIGKAFL